MEVRVDQFDMIDIENRCESDPPLMQALIARGVDCSYQVSRVDDDGVKDLELRPCGDWQIDQDFSTNQYVVTINPY